MAKISLENLGKRFDGAEVVKGVDLEIADGEFVVLVGPSGCGKSTTLRMLAGLEAATSGTIRFGDAVVNDWTPRERNIAMVFQSYALYPHMTVARNMGFALEQSRMPKAEIGAMVRRTAQLLNISDLLDRKPKALSGGQRQRVAMGRAIVRHPEVFLFDEPLSNLDAALRTQMRMEIRKLHQALKTTVIYVTHDQIEAMTLADRIVVMDKGQVVQVGTPMEVYERPQTRFVASFIGAPPMNFIPATIRADAAGAIAVEFAEGIRWPVPAAHVARFQRLAGEAIEIAVRPEHLMEHGKGVNVVEFDAAPSALELTGANTMVMFPLNGVEVCAVCRSDWNTRVGQPMRFAVSFDRLYTIDPATGRVGQPTL
jgi:multiple sugar transport system ATP-binding protein